MGLSRHRPILLKEVMHFLNPLPGNVIIDATIGGGGHSEEIIQKIYPSGKLIGIDRDTDALRIAQERLESLGRPFKLINKNFRDIKEIVQDLGMRDVDGILFDLGISSIQMETAERGFSIKGTGPLDMRMDRRDGRTAKDLVNRLSENELSCLIRDLGEERFHRRIARGIVIARKRKKIETTKELAEIILNSIPYRRNRERIHPATRTFQAFRIKVNEELVSLEEAIRETPNLLRRGGRVCVISFHSLEDRIVKNVLREFKAEGFFDIITKKPVPPEREEIFENPRARSAKLRAAVRS